MSDKTVNNSEKPEEKAPEADSASGAAEKNGPKAGKINNDKRIVESNAGLLDGLTAL